jgi:hypothetical protein
MAPACAACLPLIKAASRPAERLDRKTKESDLSRPEAIRRLVELGLKAKK